MREIKLYAVGSHQTKERTSGVDFARVLQPMKYLNGYKDSTVSFCIDFYDINSIKQPSWVEIADAYDAVFLNYTVLDWQYAVMGACMHGKGKKIIMDIDDAIWYLRPDNITYETIMANNKKMLHDVTCILDDVDRVTVTSSYLRNIVCDKTYKRHEQVGVFPNYIDLELYKYRYPSVDREQITIMHFGSTTHFMDLQQETFVKGMDMIMKEFPNVKFVTVGAFIPELRRKFGSRYENKFGDVDIYKWIQNKFPLYMEEADIVVAPVEEDIYNKAKSSIKFLEYSSAMKPGVYQNIRQYQEVVEDGKNGFLATTAEEWYGALKQLVLSHEMRRKIGENAFNTIQSHQMKDHISEYANFIKTALDIA